METLYRKVAVSERMPNRGGTYFSNEGEVFYSSYHKEFQHDYDPRKMYPEWWLEEISDFIPETIEKSIQAIAQLQADKAELLEALKKLRNHYGLFPENRMEIESLIKKHKNDKRGNITED